MKPQCAPDGTPNFNKQGVIGITFSKDRKRVLLIKRCDVPVWVLPGGGIDVGETPEQAIIREMKEETGYDVELCRKVAEYTPKCRLTTFTHLYECHILSGTPSLSNETQGVQFFPLDDLPSLPNLPPPFPGWIRDATIPLAHTLKKKMVGVSYPRLMMALILYPILTLRFLLAKMGMPINSSRHLH